MCYAGSVLVNIRLGRIVIVMEDNQEIPEILKPTWAGESIFCANCGHHLNQHFTDSRTAYCTYKATGNGVCRCREFKATNIVKVLDTGQHNEYAAMREVTKR
jgi:hypothetical protein